MSTASSFVFTAGCILGALCELARYAFRFGWALLLPKARLAARVLAAESQLAVELNRSGRSKRRRQFTPAFRLLWVALSKLVDGWEGLAHLMKPETVTRWHRRAFRMFWRWRSRRGRRPIPDEVQQLIRRLSRENPLCRDFPDGIRPTLTADLSDECITDRGICKRAACSAQGASTRLPVVLRGESASKQPFSGDPNRPSPSPLRPPAVSAVVGVIAAPSRAGVAVVSAP